MENEQPSDEIVHYEDSTEEAQPVYEPSEMENGQAKQASEVGVETDASKQNHKGRGAFVDGLLMGLGIGCVAAFIMMWIAVFFTPLLPSAITYEAMLSIFIYPLVYLLALGLVSLTAGVVREFYAAKH